MMKSKLIVVADNCSDNTASVAVEAGAEVRERKYNARCQERVTRWIGLFITCARRPLVSSFS